MPKIENLSFRISVSKGTSLGRVATKEKNWESFKAMFDRTKVLVDASCTFAQYQALDVDRQSKKKLSAGNWMPALFKDGRRKGANQLCRTMVVFDLDYVSVSHLDIIRLGFAPICSYAWFMHTTRSHCPEKPRVRLIVPVDREMTLEECHALTRLLACELAENPEEAIEIPDSVSMKSNQVMYLPSISRDQEYWTDENNGKLLDVDQYLARHPHWDDHALLPYKGSEKNRVKIDLNRKIEDPHKKDGVIGAFCRVYDVEEAIAKFLPDIYAPGDASGSETRYTYLLGSSSNGAIVYDGGRFLFSHHGTDPIEGAANSFDLVRIHKFGPLDEDAPANTRVGNLPSFRMMADLAREDEHVNAEILSNVLPDDAWDDEDEERSETCDELERAALDFSQNDEFDDCEICALLGGNLAKGSADEKDESQVNRVAGKNDDDDSDERAKLEPKTEERKWQSDLMLDNQQRIEKSLHNCATIVKNSDQIAPCIALNDLDGGPYLRRLLNFPKANLAQANVNNSIGGRRWTDNDTAALMCALAAPRKMGGYATQFSRQDVELSLLQAAEQNRYNPFLDKIRAVEWDGVARLATFFHDSFFAEDNAYHAELATTWFVAGIARQYEPGHRYDLVPILGGKQGGGKTGAIEELGMGYGGSLSGDFHDTQKMTESTKGKTVLEVPELKGLSKSEIEDVKHYFTATKDTVRLAYRRNEEDFYRRCVYMGTTNQNHYLRDDENRRFCPVVTDTGRHRMIDFDNFIPRVPQLWAEAHHIYLAMREKTPLGMLPLHFTSKEAEAEAHRLQAEARETLPYEPVQEVVAQWLNQPLTPEQIEIAGTERKIDQEFDDEETGGRMYLRNLVTVTMIREKLELNPIIRELRGAHADKTISQAIQKLPGWQSIGNVNRLGRRARWYCREGEDTKAEFVSTVHRVEVSVEDLLN